LLNVDVTIELGRSSRWPLPLPLNFRAQFPPTVRSSDAMKRLVTMSSLLQGGTPALQRLLHQDLAVASSCLLAANVFCISSKAATLRQRIDAFNIGIKSIAKCAPRQLLRRFGVGTREAAIELMASSLAVSGSVEFDWEC
jgi:hypothetical protein